MGVGLGFRMTVKSTRDDWHWRALHLTMALVLPVVLFTLVGCMKGKAKKEDLGPEVSPEAIDQALSKAIGTGDVTRTAVGQYLLYSTVRRLENADSVITLGGTRVEVLDRQDKDADPLANFTLRITQSTRMGDGSFETTQSESPLTFRKPATATSLALPSSLRRLNAKAIVERAMEETPLGGGGPVKTTFHHLQESSATIDPPPTVKAKSNCGGLNPCQLDVRYVQFDLVMWSSDTDYQKVALDFAFTSQVPFLPYGQDDQQLSGLLLTDCRSTYVPIEKRTVYVRDCLNLDDFQK